MRNPICRSGLYLLVLALCVCTNHLSAQQPDFTPKTRPVTLFYKNTPLGTIMRDIEVQIGVHILGNYNRDLSLNVEITGGVVADFFEQYLVPKGYTWRWQGEDQIIVYPPAGGKVIPADSALAMPVVVPLLVSGIVTNDARLPIPGATIQLHGEKRGTQTDISGRFQLWVSSPHAMLEVRSIGSNPQQVAVAGRTFLRIQLEPADQFLGQVLITGYGESKKRFITSGLSQVNLRSVQQVGTHNAFASLQGMVPGLQVDQTSGSPGSAVTMQLRGRNSVMNIAGPLIVINQIPYVGSFPLVNLRPSIATQNMNGGLSAYFLQMFGEIESITVLKDAEATSIYGSRGANGVILIETVRGKPGKLMLDAILLRGAGKVASWYDLYDTERYLVMRNEAARNDGLTPGDTPGTINYMPDLKRWGHGYTDWQKELIGKTAHITDLQLALSFGNTQTQVRLGGNYYRETTVFNRDMFYGRMGVTATVDHASKNERFLVNAYGLYSTDHNYSFNGSVRGVFTPPNATAGVGEHNNLLWEPGLMHPYADFRKLYSLAKRNYLISAVVQWKPLDSLSLRTNLGFSGLTTNERDQLPIASQNPLLSDNLTGSSTLAGKSIWGTIIEPILEYKLPYVPGLSVLAGASFQYTSTTNHILTGEGYTNDADLLQLAKAPYFSTNVRNRSAYIYSAFFGQLKYQRQDKYLINANLRRDASSRFGPAENSGYFWSVGAGWIFSEEAFAKKHLRWLRFGKLRASMGLSGSDLVEDDQYQAVWGSNPVNNPYQGVQGLSPQAPFNPGFSWELCRKKEVGLELAFWGGRVQTSFSYYANKSYNQILHTNLSASAGFPSMLRNGPAVILNSGFEATVSADLIQSTNVQLQVGTNLSLPRNKVVAFENLEQSPYYGKLLLNEPVTVLNKLESGGVDPKTGLYLLKDRDGLAGYTVGDYIKRGSLDPRLLIGVQINFSWKQFTLDVVMDIRDQMGWSALYPMLLADQFPGGLSNQITDLDNRWQQSGDEGKKYQRLSSQPAGPVNGTKNLLINSDLSYSSTGYGKVRELSLYYTLNDRQVSRAGCKSMRLFFTGRNLWTISRYTGGDPEIGNVQSLSTLRTTSFGFQVSL